MLVCSGELIVQLYECLCAIEIYLNDVNLCHDFSRIS